MAAELDYEVARKKALYGGLIGLDRFYLGDKTLGTWKVVLTCLTLGIYTIPWWVIDYVIITRHKDDWEQ
ncbi:MAG: NINE protein [Candidatus Saccharimonadales bacterium]